MYIKHSTKIPIQLSDELIQKVLETHNQILKESINTERVDTNDGKWKVTQPSTIPAW